MVLRHLCGTISLLAGGRVKRQGSHPAVSSLIFVSEDPDVSRRWDNTGKEQIIEKRALGGIGTGCDCPTGPVVVQE